MPFGTRRQCDVCLLIEAEHPQPLGNDCYRRAIAAHFPVSAVGRQHYESPLQAHQAAVAGLWTQNELTGLWKALRRAS